jgi:hypothetical protein
LVSFLFKLEEEEEEEREFNRKKKHLKCERNNNFEKINKKKVK